MPRIILTDVPAGMLAENPSAIFIYLVLVVIVQVDIINVFDPA